MGDFENEMMLGSGGTSNPKAFIYSQYGYRHDYLGQPVTPGIVLLERPAGWQKLEAGR